MAERSGDTAFKSARKRRRRFALPAHSKYGLCEYGVKCEARLMKQFTLMFILTVGLAGCGKKSTQAEPEAKPKVAEKQPKVPQPEPPNTKPEPGSKAGGPRVSRIVWA